MRVEVTTKLSHSILPRPLLLPPNPLGHPKHIQIILIFYTIIHQIIIISIGQINYILT